MANNPAAIALHEARQLFPHAKVGCLVSFGTGCAVACEAPKQNSLYQTLKTVVKAATRTDVVHHMLQDLLPASDVQYFRFNPPIPSGVGIDATDIATLVALQAHGRDFVTEGGGGAGDMTALVELLAGGLQY